MTPNLDIYRSAQVLVTQHGQDALIEAAVRANAMLDKGNLDGLPIRRVARAVTCHSPRMLSQHSKHSQGLLTAVFSL